MDDAADGSELEGGARDPSDLATRDRPLPPLARPPARRSCDEVRVDARDRLLEHRVHVDVLYHRSADPCSGMMMSTWAPGKGGRPSFKGTSSSHGGTIAMRAVPLRIAILPVQRTR